MSFGPDLFFALGMPGSFDMITTTFLAPSLRCPREHLAGHGFERHTLHFTVCYTDNRLFPDI
jgi:hypothetical protein